VPIETKLARALRAFDLVSVEADDFVFERPAGG
jgi:hypothetical protein